MTQMKNGLHNDKLRFPWLAALIAACFIAPSTLVADPEKAFLNPPESAKPGVLWMWMGCNLSKPGITRDLEALKSAGFNRTTMFSLADVTTPWAGEIQNSPTPEIISWTEPWWQMVRHAALESKRLGMDFGMFNGPSYESSGGPWITAENSMQEICFSQTPVTGGGKISVELPRPKVDPRAVQAFPVFNPKTGLVEKPEIPERATYFRDIAVLAMPAEGAVAKDQIIDLSTKLAADGKLTWSAPAGNWVVYRFGHTTMGTLIQPAQWKATGFECDKMSRKAVEFHMNHVIGGIQKHLGDLIGSSFTHVHFDSYEAGIPSWTPLMREDFAKRRGYDLTPFLATFAGRTVGSDDESNKFRSDFDATIKDLYNDYFSIIKKTLNDAKLEFLCEPYGGPWRQDEVMPKVDRVMTEFWTNGGRYTPYEVDPTIAALRLSGQNIIEAEAFTGLPGDSQWNETPEWLKPMGDAAYCAGINRFVLHRFPQQPWDERYLPGATMGLWGTHFDRTQTWWEPGKAMVAYWQRCQALLQWGSFVTALEDFSVFRAQGKIEVKSIHRRDGQTDVYFVANTERVGGTAWCGFDVEDRQPELWDPVTGTMRVLKQFEVRDGKTLVPLDFDPAQSFFIVFRKPIETKVAEANFPTLKPHAELSGEWQVSFDPKWGGPAEPVRFEKLEDWTRRPEPGIKYYSGTAVYRKSFDLAGVNTPLQLDLGTVHCIARVKLNGKDLGVVWCAPWSITLPPGALKAGSNQLEIEITNVWANRLIGDEQEPADCEWSPGHHFNGQGGFLKRFPDWFVKNEPRPSKGRFCFTTWNYFTKDSPLIASGLLGPVRLMTEDWVAGVKPPLPPGAEAFFDEQVISDPNAPLVIAALTDPNSAAGLEGGLLRGNLLAPDQGTTVADESFAHDGGGTNADALRNGTTRNGGGGAETQNDGKTFRGYAKNNSITFRLDTARQLQGYDLTSIATFAGHFGGRASQSYSVLIALAADPTKFVKLTDAALNFNGAASRLRLSARDGAILAKGVAAVRFEFHDGPIGFNVYREIQVIGKASNP